MAKIELTNNQLRLIQRALDFYSRVGILQFEEIVRHPTIDNSIDEQFTPKKKLEVGDETMRGEIVEIGKKFIKTKGSWGKGEEIKKWTDIDKIKLSPDWSEIHRLRDQITYHFNHIKCMIDGENQFSNGGHLGIHHKKVDESCREAFDIVQVIRHEFWKADEKRSTITVDSSISLCTSAPQVKVELDTIANIRKQKLIKIKKK
jgi:hypothetical protein